ncbi:Os03g0652600 [Oryza sativa Japonica Group]|uniref:Os03g0652600 protein n=1 Tax=Oryza sativa subsp. japonica TaxID=39947 RepID=A0A0P0W1E9_ORYSJ|nr:hypothetical protein EE612_019334 [Oryza sativa]BAS85530.1 Os03g0652600 [Oryza sativa Japonica Group]
MSSSGVGVIGRRSVSDHLGAIGDNLSVASASTSHDLLYNLRCSKLLTIGFHNQRTQSESKIIFQSTLQSPLPASRKFRHL